MKPRLSLILPAAALMLVPLAGTAGAAPESNAFCTIAGRVAPTPGIGYAPAAGKYTLSGTLSCSSDAPSHGTVTGEGAGTLGCLGGMSEAVLKVVWDDESTSTITMQFGDFTYGTGGFGSVAEGVFKGKQVGTGWGREAAAAEMRCAAGGVKTYEFAGGMAIGSPAS